MDEVELLVLSVLASSLAAQSVVVPNASATVGSGGGLNTLVRNAGNPRTYQQGINASELTGIPVGAVITGVSLRFAVLTGTNSPSWPAAPAPARRQRSHAS